jgi:hypothetical protein
MHAALFSQRGETDMRNIASLFGSASALRRVGLAAAASAALLGVSAAPAAADYCIQLSGGITGDIGFYRFKGQMPTEANDIVTLRGRAAGLSPVFGTAVVAQDGSYVELGATFFVDSVEGQFDITFSPPTSKTGSGYASYGEYDVNDPVDAKVVNCSKETTFP